MKTIVTMGRGGTGKTTFVALMARYLIEKNIRPYFSSTSTRTRTLPRWWGSISMLPG